jgi:DNA invertase Pin-like site-specific DNA recombinase
VRVSQVNGRAGQSFASPAEQADRIRTACARDGLRLVRIVDELDVSGGRPLDQRPGLGPAVQAVESGDADVIVGAYFDRLFRSLRAQGEAVDRVERAGGQVLAVDVGRVTNGSAGQWLSGTMLGTVSEYQRRTAAERSREAQTRAIARGVAPWPNIPPGYVRGANGRLVVDEAAAAAVKQAYALRADGATIAEVRAHLAACGIERSYHGVTVLLGSRIVLGEIHFGDYEPNLRAHPAIVDRDTWLAVQRATIARGRKPKSERLLARLGVLRCASCGGRMVVGTQTSRGRTYPFYRCGHVREDCANRVTVSATLVERLVADAVKQALTDVEGRASAQSNARDAEATLQRTQAALDAAIRAFAGMEDEDAARERLLELRAARDDAEERVDRLGGDGAVLVINAVDDWDRLTIDAQRALIRATVERVLVGPGRGADRVTLELFAQ